MRRFLISCAVVAVALLAQLTFVNRLALPGEAGPDLVLLAVVALALTGGPLPGLLTGFLAGLALDVAPPASHTIGQYALVFCLVGYGCGRLAGLGDASPGLYVAISAAAAAGGAALHAALGVMLSDPEVTWAAVRHVLPPSLIYDVILSPFVLYAVVRLNGWADRSATGDNAAAATASASWTGGAAGLTGLAAGAVRQAGAPGTPKLHLGDRRGSEAWISAPARTAGTARPGAQRRPGSQREPRLHFGGSRGTGGQAGRRGRRPGRDRGGHHPGRRLEGPEDALHPGAGRPDRAGDGHDGPGRRTALPQAQRYRNDRHRRRAEPGHAAARHVRRRPSARQAPADRPGFAQRWRLAPPGFVRAWLIRPGGVRAGRVRAGPVRAGRVLAAGSPRPGLVRQQSLRAGLVRSRIVPAGLVWWRIARAGFVRRPPRPAAGHAPWRGARQGAAVSR